MGRYLALSPWAIGSLGFSQKDLSAAWHHAICGRD
ncbi:MAG: SPW repeat protein [Arthrobacter sp.]